MAKGAATDWKVMVGNVELSSWAFDVAIDDSREKLETSGFNPQNARTYVPGLRDQAVTIQFRNDRASGGPHQTLEPYYRSGSSFAFYVLPDSDTGTSAANPLYGGSAALYSFPTQATLNEVEEIEIEFAPASNSVFNWGTTFPPT